MNHVVWTQMMTNQRYLDSRFRVNKNKYKIKLRFLKSSEHFNDKGDGPHRGFGYLGLFSDPINLATWSQRKLLQFYIFQQESRYKD